MRVVRQDGLELLEGQGRVAGDLDVLHAARHALDVVKGVRELRLRVGGFSAIFGGLDLDAARAQPRLLLRRGLEFLLLGERGSEGGWVHPPSRVGKA